MSGAHTPGAWSIRKTPNTNLPKAHWRELMANGEVVLGELFESDVGADATEANARLIAAAPELLEALVALRPHIYVPEGDTAFAAAMEKARAAIAKATGA